LTDPLFPPFCDVCAVIVTFPDRLPVTTPLPDTVAVLVLELDQKKVWFGMMLPLLSVAVAESCMVDPGFSFLDGAVTATLEPDSYPHALRDVLAAAIRSSPHLYPSVSPDRSLGELVAALWRIEEAAAAERRLKRLTLYRRFGLWVVLMVALVIAQPPVLQPREEVPAPILLGTWVVVAIIAYWLAGRLLALYENRSSTFDVR